MFKGNQLLSLYFNFSFLFVYIYVQLFARVMKFVYREDIRIGDFTIVDPYWTS